MPELIDAINIKPCLPFFWSRFGNVHPQGPHGFRKPEFE